MKYLLINTPTLFHNKVNYVIYHNVFGFCSLVNGCKCPNYSQTCWTLNTFYYILKQQVYKWINCALKWSFTNSLQ